MRNQYVTVDILQKQIKKNYLLYRLSFDLNVH